MKLETEIHSTVRVGDLGHCFMFFLNQYITGKDLQKDEVDFNSRPVHSDYIHVLNKQQ
jgi:hypothetical protein